jgi:hypothetical protein
MILPATSMSARAEVSGMPVKSSIQPYCPASSTRNRETYTFQLTRWLADERAVKVSAAMTACAIVIGFAGGRQLGADSKHPALIRGVNRWGLFLGRLHRWPASRGFASKLPVRARQIGFHYLGFGRERSQSRPKWPESQQQRRSSDFSLKAC